MDPYNKIIATNLYKLRTDKNMSLDNVCALTGISKSMLSQIEKGTANPSVTTLWKLANGFKISFTELMQSDESEVELYKVSTTQPLEECNGHFRNYPIVHFDAQRRFETYQVEIDPHTQMDAEAHNKETLEYVTVIEGALTLVIGDDRHELKQGDTLKFRADRPHGYYNLNQDMCRLFMVLYYPS